MQTYKTRNEAIYREIIQPIEATEEALASEYNIHAIANELVMQTTQGADVAYCLPDLNNEFWTVVERNEL